MSEGETKRMPFVYDDGGRVAAGYKGHAGDCVTRSVVIASGLSYAEVYDVMAAGTGAQRASKRTKKRAASARAGINTKRKWFKDYMASIGFRWVATMHIGQGCKVHLAAGELPMGRLVVAVSGHYTAVVDGVVRDTWDPQRDESWEIWNNVTPEFIAREKRPGDIIHEGPNGTELHKRIGGRCVYGYWTRAENA